MSARLLAIILLACAALAVRAAADDETPDQHAARQLALGVKDISVDKVQLHEVIDFVRDVAGVEIWVDWMELDAAGVDRDAPATVTLKDGTIEGVLSAALDSASAGKAKLTFEVSSGAVVVSTEAAFPDSVVAARRLAHKAKSADDRSLIETVVPELSIDLPLSAAIARLEKTAGARIDVDWPKLAAAGVRKEKRVAIKAKSVPVGRALLLVLEKAEPKKGLLDFTLKDNVFRVSTAASLAGAAGAKDNPPHDPPTRDRAPADAGNNGPRRPDR